MLFNKKGTTPKGKTWGEVVENEKADAVEKVEPATDEGLNEDLELEEKEPETNAEETLSTPKEEKEPKKEAPKNEEVEEVEEVEEDDAQDKEVHDVIEKYTGVDFKKMSKEKMFDVIYELLVELKKTRHSLSKYDYENLDFYQSTQNAIKEKKNAEELIEYIARKLSPTYIKNIVDSVNKKYTSSQLADLILKDTFESKRKLQEKVIKLEEESIQHKRLLDELKKQLTEQMNKRAVAAEDVDREDVQADTIDDFVASVEDNAVESLGSKGGSIALVAVDIDKAKDALGEVEMAIIEIMGKEGISLYPEILSKCVEERKYTESKVKTAFGRLEQYKVIAGEMVQTAKIKRGVRIADLTDEVGKPIFKDKFGANPVESEKARTIKDHGNLAHGYSIKETALILEGLGYQNVTTGRVENKISIGDNKYWVPDVIGINPITGKKEYFEVEFGNHNADNFDDKMTKANLKANILRFIVPSELVKTKIKNKVEHWRASQNPKLATMEISIGTVSDLESKTYGLEIK